MSRHDKRKLIVGSFILIGLISLVLISVGRPHSVYSTFADKRQFAESPQDQNKARQAGKPPTPQDRVEYRRNFPTADYESPEPSDPAEKTKRKNKGKHFDKMNLVDARPSPYWSILMSHWAWGLPALPVNQSSAVLIVELLKSEAHFSNDKTGIYSEFASRVEEVLKSADPLLSKGSLTSVTRVGGVVRYRSGEESLCAIADQNMPSVGKHYLLFLKMIEDTQDYEIITGYEIETGNVSPLDRSQQFQTYDGVDNATFLKAVRDAIAQPQAQKTAQ